MVRLEKETAIIGTVNELLLQGVGTTNPDGKGLLINEDIVFKYSRMMEIRSGYAVVNGFSGDSLNRFFSNCNRLFQYDPFVLTQENKPSYRLRTEELLECSEGNLYGLSRSQINAAIGRMIDILDPNLNYPLDFLEDMQLLGVLEANGENDRVVTKPAEKRKNIKELFADFHGEYAPMEVNWGSLVGEEKW